ncbi:hypothetical protein YC2023_065641 [Brassica napus]
MSWRQRNMKVLARQHEERGYRFRWRGLIVGTAGVYPRFLHFVSALWLETSVMISPTISAMLGRGVTKTDGAFDIDTPL